MNAKPKKTHRWVKVLLALLLTLTLLCAALAGFVLLGKAGTLRLTLRGVTPLALSDGVYTGSYSAFRFSNTVEVSVQNRRIAGIEVVTGQVFAKPETIATLTDRVLAAQTTAVDAVTGATADSKAFLKAVENALAP